MDDRLSRRERQIMDILYRRGRATIAEVLADLPDPPTDSAIRAALRLLGQKGRVERRPEGAHNVYAPTVPLPEARRSALDHVIETFFKGSRERALAAMLELDDADLTDEELEELANAIRKRQRRRGSTRKRREE